MCGRYTLTKNPQAELRPLGISEELAFRPRYNIAPGQMIPVVLCEPELNNRVMIRSLEWGLIAPWQKERNPARLLINARSETLEARPSFRGPARHHRCLIPADGFYEWKSHQDRSKAPFYFTMENETIFFMAGIWNSWESANGEFVDSAAVITTPANSVVRQVHSRMPAIIRIEDAGDWLSPAIQTINSFKELLLPFSSEGMQSCEVGKTVNNAHIDSRDCLTPAGRPAQQHFL